MDSLEKISNKFAVLQDDYDADFPVSMTPQNQKIVDRFISRRLQLSDEILKDWNEDMKEYFKEKWKEGEIVNESDKEDVFDDYSDTVLTFRVRLDQLVNFGSHLYYFKILVTHLLITNNGK